MSRAGFFRLGRGYRATAVLLLNTLILLVCLEAAAGLALRALDRQAERRWQQQQTSLSYYAAQPWAKSYWHDHRQLQVQYAPYIIWRQRPYTGETITIDSQGYRATSGALCTPGAYRVFVFGGSAVWGHGAPDWGTIPAYLQTELAKGRDGPVCVQNFGEQAFVSTQGVIELLRQLQSGSRPDLVLFYDGFNDIAATYQNGRAGAHLNETRTGARFSQEQTFTGWLQTTNMYRLALRAAERSGFVAAVVVPEPALADTAVLSGQLFQAYFTNYQLVAALAAEYGFAYHFFWQPLLDTGNKSLTAEEAQMVAADSPWRTFYRQVYADMAERAAGYPCLNLLTHIFDGQTALVWLDNVHVTPAANEQIAREMAHLVQTQTEACGP